MSMCITDCRLTAPRAAPTGHTVLQYRRPPRQLMAARSARVARAMHSPSDDAATMRAIGWPIVSFIHITAGAMTCSDMFMYALSGPRIAATAVSPAAMQAMNPMSMPYLSRFIGGRKR